jgi:SAM-dependent methyltransferase
VNPAPANASVAKCHNCGAGPLLVAPGYERLHRVSSDCQSCPPGGQLGVCPACGLVQAVTDERWQQEAREIYGAYRIYHQSGGEEQPVFDPRTGKGRARSEVLIEELLPAAKLPGTGRLLDIGCGNGAFLRACSRALPGWKLCGSEFDTRHQATVESIRGVEKFHSGSLADIPGKFDVISLIHVLEHIPGPTEFLKTVAAKLAPQGWLFVEVPDCSANPFMLLVADHSSHFSPSSLSTVVGNAGFELVRVGPPWVAKEISLLARLPQRAAESQQTYGHWEFLRHVAREVTELARREPFGIFGTSIGATWLNAQTGRTAAFFVDEDPQRMGKQHAERPILGVTAIAPQSTVYIALPPALAEPIAQRLRGVRPDVTFLTPGTTASGGPIPPVANSTDSAV